MIQRLWVLGPCSHICAQQVHVYGFATSTCVFTFVGAWPMFTRLCTAGACSCVCHEHMCFRVCGCLAHVHTLVHSRCMVLCVCVPRAHVFQRLWVLGPCSHACAQPVHGFVCVCHERMCFNVCGCLAHVHTFVHSRCMFMGVPRAHMILRLWVLGPSSHVCAQQVHVLVRGHEHMCFHVCGCLAHVHTFVGAWPMFTRLCTAGACFSLNYLCSKNTCDFMCVVVCPCEVFYMFPRVWNHVDCTY